MASFFVKILPLFFPLNVEQGQNTAIFCKKWVFVMFGNHCNGATDLKTKFETEDLVKEKQWNALDDQKKRLF